MCVEVDDILTPLYPGVAWKTRVWASEGVQAAIVDFTGRRERPRGYFLDRLKYYAETGFELWIRDDRPVRLEWDGVYRIGHRRNLFRVYGFFENNTTKDDFIALDAFVKRGQRLTGRETQRINEVVNSRMDQNWKRRGE